MVSDPSSSQAPLPASRPRFRAPAGATDCHFHIFGPQDRYPLNSIREYTPSPTASLDAYLALASTLGIERMVVVHPTPYGIDHRCTIDSIEILGSHRTKGVALINDSIAPATLLDMDRRGFCAARVNSVARNGTPVSQLPAVARLVAPLGWHVEVYVEGKQLPNLADTLLSQPVPVVIDHIGLIPTNRGVNSAEFLTLLRLLSSGKCWVKLCGYRSSSAGPPYADLLAPVQKIIETAPERCVWGSDWPHSRREGPLMPDDGKLLDLLYDWAPSPQNLHRILVSNPAKLYRFPNIST